MKQLAVVIIFFTLVSLASAQSTATPAPSPACTAPEFHQFDFWIGKWAVHSPAGKEVGSSEITRASEGCAIREDWTSIGTGQHGMSINYFDPSEKRWHQDWVGADGTILHLIGGLQDNAMVMADAQQANRIRWTPQPDGTVKQEWTISSDHGKTWQPSFVGIYKRR